MSRKKPQRATLFKLNFKFYLIPDSVSQFKYNLLCWRTNEVMDVRSKDSEILAYAVELDKIIITHDIKKKFP